jgi:type I restriction enzyme S subunit
MTTGLETAKLGDLIQPAQTWNPLRSDAERVFDYIDLSAVDQDQKLITEARQISCAEAPSRARQIVQHGDVLVSTVRPNLNGVARVTKSLDGATASTGFCVLRAKASELDGSYLFHWVKSPVFVADMVKKATGASYPAVSDRIIFESPIPLPPLLLQRRIAEVLDKAEALRAKRRAALAQLDSLTQSLFLDLFGDPATNPKGWPLKPVGSLASKFSDGPFGSNLKSEHYTEIGVRVIRLQNIGVGEFVDDDAAYISEPHFAKLKKHDCRPGDVLVGTMGDPNLRACIQPDWLPVALNKADCVQLRPDEGIANAIFVCALLNQPATERMAHDLMQGQTRVRISMGRLRGLEVPLPPLDLQREFARRITAVEKLKTAQRAALAELDALFASLQHRAFRGEL